MEQTETDSRKNERRKESKTEKKKNRTTQADEKWRIRQPEEHAELVA